MSYVKRVSQRALAESRGLSAGAPVSSHAQGMLTGWVRINTVTRRKVKVISQLL